MSRLEVAGKSDNLVSKILFLVKKVNGILKNLSVEESRETTAQELTNLVNSPELLTLLVTCAASDNMAKLIDALLRYVVLFEQIFVHNFT